MNSFVAALQKFGIGRLAAILGIGAGVAAALFALTMGLGEPKALLYSNLDLKEAGSITAALDQGGVKYEVKGDGSTIMVPRDEVASTRLMLSGKGLPTSGSVGYEIFDGGNTMGQTDFVQQLNRQRALEGELARTIQSLDGVASARVHLVLPKRQLFEEEAEQPSASVSIGVGGREPSQDQVQAIQNLIASAVPNLKPGRVTVVDQHAKQLSAGEDGFAGQAADGRRSEVEQRIAKTVKGLVEGVVGAGKARVNVTADLDLARVTVQQETFDPDGQVIRSESTNEESAKENAADANGGVSASANIPTGAGANDEGLTGSTSATTTSTTNYEISKTTRTEVNEPGQVKRLSVAVAIDGATALGADGKPGAYTPRSAQEMARIEQLVRTAVGYNADRGDQVTVVNVRFPTVADAGGTEAANPLMGFDKNDIMRAVELAILALVAILMMLFVVRPLLRNSGGGGGGGRSLSHLTAAGPGMTRVVTTNDGQQMQVQVDPATGQALALPGPGNELEQRIDIARIEGQVKASSVKRVAEFVDNHPEESVSLLRTWLHETT
ncbi:flagellar M-ring protein FliF [Phenylobacterium sp. LH3H17]|uniref:flagellar basal-body MS-ring/collar protein FliF n=1 Tax=Phenylobacterium sp. LH3H17 TaxID=2903901 RepID=UPI0020C94943|nr:flagellar basal-body MS-ring/collar protein FliF [Phenylobacterium sp. LH3H17]UTP40695.1 flagellar M-ring protein FliF [Phenylobacterium sp. LH3H17]